MTEKRRVLWLVVGLVLGGIGTALYESHLPRAMAYNDRSEEYILCTGAVAIMPQAPTEGVWLLDYRAGKLLGTLIDRSHGKIVGWAEVDLVTEFGLPPRHNVHFMMTTGMIARGQAALYIAETTSGKFGVYTMSERPDGQPGITIRRHDLKFFRQPPKRPS